MCLIMCSLLNRMGQLCKFNHYSEKHLLISKYEQSQVMIQGLCVRCSAYDALKHSHTEHTLNPRSR